jgi:hypothetical protein
MAEKLIGSYRLVVGEMSWKSQLECSRQYNHWLWNESKMLPPFEKQVAIATLFALNAPVSLYKDNQLLPPGTYTLDNGVQLILPLTVDHLNALPVSIAQFIVQAALEANPQTRLNFIEGTAETLEMLKKQSELPSASGQ